MCRKRPFTTHADRLRSRLEGGRLPVAGSATRYGLRASTPVTSGRANAWEIDVAGGICPELCFAGRNEASRAVKESGAPRATRARGAVPRLGPPASSALLRGRAVATDTSRSAPDDREAARFNHIWASTLSCGTPSPLVYHDSEVVLGAGVALLGGQAARPDPVPYMTPEVVLRVGAALLSGAAGDRFNIILLDTATSVVHVPEIALGVGVALLGGQAVPPDGFHLVLRHA